MAILLCVVSTQTCSGYLERVWGLNEVAGIM